MRFKRFTWHGEQQAVVLVRELKRAVLDPDASGQSRSSLAQDQEAAFAADRLRLAGRAGALRWQIPILRN